MKQTCEIGLQSHMVAGVAEALNLLNLLGQEDKYKEMIDRDISELADALLVLMPRDDRIDPGALQEVFKAADLRLPSVEGTYALAVWKVLQRSKDRSTLSDDVSRLVCEMIRTRYSQAMPLPDQEMVLTIASALSHSSASAALQPVVLESVHRISALQCASPLVVSDIRLVRSVLARASMLKKPKFSYIAAQLQRQPQSVSESIGRVEEIFGVALFEGTVTKRKATPTTIGRTLQNKFTRLINSWDDILLVSQEVNIDLKNRPRARRIPR